MRRGRTILYEFLPFALLCFLTASRWLVEGGLPDISSTLLSQGVGCAMAAGFVGIVAAVRRRLRVAGWSDGGRHVGAWAGCCLVLVGPVVAQALGGRHLGAEPATLGLALVPVVVGVAASASGNEEAGDLPGLLWPGLAGLGGLLLVLPQPSFSAWRPWGGLVALPLLVGLGSWLAVQSETAETVGEGNWGGVPVIWGLLLAACVFGGYWLASSGGAAPRVALGACGLDGLSALLTLTTLRRLGARRWSSQFLFVPLLGLLEGLVFLRPVLDARSWLGLGLIAVGGMYQLFAGAKPAGSFSLRSGEDVPGA